jgi:GNAT superfamily N-acetyltransferase
LERGQLEDAIEVLSVALEGDPLMHYFFHTQGADYRQNIRDLFRFSCQVRFELGWAVLGIVLDSKLVGVANVTEPEEASWPESLVRRYENLKSAIGTEATGRLERYSEITDSFRPADPHYHVGVGGFLPEAQGKGYGRKLIEEIHALSEAHPTSNGVALDTENPRNVPIYQHLGYEITAETQIDDMVVWCMFRMNE